jgi:hypothetical protein
MNRIVHAHRHQPKGDSNVAEHAAQVSGRTVHALGDDGAIRDWLVSPAWRSPCEDLGTLLDADGSPWVDDGRWTLTQGPEVAPLKGRIYQRRPLVTQQALPDVTEGGTVAWVAPGGSRTDTGTWRRFRTQPDGLVDWSDFCFQPEYRHAVAGTVIEVDQPEWRTIEVGCTGPVAVWLGEEQLATYTDVSYMEPVTHTVRVRLRSGLTPLLLATWQVGFREVRHVARVAVRGLPVRVVIPSAGADERASAVAESVLEAVAADSWAVADGQVGLSGPAGAALRVSRPLRGPQRIVLEGGRAVLPLSAGDDAGGTDGRGRADGSASMLTTGETTLTIAVDDDRCPVTRQLPVAVLPPRVRTEPAGDDPQAWRREVLAHAAESAPSVARALAASSLAASPVLDPADLRGALSMLRGRADCADFEAVGLLNLWHALTPADAWPAGTRDEVRQALLGFKYWIDQPGLDAMCYFTENHQLVFHTAELLAGETFADEEFSNTGWKGAQHAEHGRQMTLEWIRAKLAGGFSEFDSNAYLAIDTLALTSLVELTAGEEIRAAAEALLDKLLFTLAANSWHGIHGAAHGRSYAQTLRSSRFEETAPIMWALWGTGALNAAVLPATCLARSRRYRLPELIRSVANSYDVPWWGRQVYQGQYSFTRDLLSRPYGSDLRVWRTADAMLSSVQDYRAGLPGLQEHIWGATLAPEVQVFATYPGSSSDSPSARPNAWAGQRVLPRARQDRDAVLVAYPGARELPAHVWFPAPLMDETAARGSWLAGRVGRGYVAVACAGGLSAVSAGSTAQQEWLPRGAGTAFAATVGSEAEDGTFAEFVRALAEPEFGAGPATTGVTWTAPDGRRLSLTGSRAFTVDGVPPDVGPDGAPDVSVHLDNPACRMPLGAHRLEASHGGHRMVLDIRHARRVETAAADAAEVTAHAR